MNLVKLGLRFCFVNEAFGAISHLIFIPTSTSLPPFGIEKSTDNTIWTHWKGELGITT
jgi:hypothetical protein